MTTKADYTADEWTGIARAPILAGAYIVASDMSTFGMFGEMRGLYRAITTHPVPDAAAEIISSVIADIKATDESKASIQMPEVKNNATAAEQMIHQLLLDLEILDRKAPHDEIVAFKRWLAGIAQATAEAGKEGGILGIGAVRVSEQEEVALATLRRQLGID